jgi:hypothetical protein
MAKQKINDKLRKAETERRALFQMYQAGFLDGYNTNSFRAHLFNKKIKLKCLKAFEIRFLSKIKETIDLKGGSKKNEKKKN